MTLFNVVFIILTLLAIVQIGRGLKVLRQDRQNDIATRDFYVISYDHPPVHVSELAEAYRKMNNIDKTPILYH